MKLIIDIDESILNDAKNGHVRLGEIADAVLSGIPLPKGHGRLIDADDLIQEITDDSQSCIFYSESERIVHDAMVNFAVDRITEASPIIEADKSESEAKNKVTTFESFLAEQLKDSEFKKEYERAKIEIEEEMRKEAENDSRTDFDRNIQK